MPSLIFSQYQLCSGTYWAQRTEYEFTKKDSGYF